MHGVLCLADALLQPHGESQMHAVVADRVSGAGVEPLSRRMFLVPVAAVGQLSAPGVEPLSHQMFLVPVAAVAGM